MSRKRRIALLGATGSIGENTLEVIRHHADKLELVAIASRNSSEALAAIAKEFDVPVVCLSDEQAGEAAAKSGCFGDRRLIIGEAGLSEIATLEEADIVVMAVVGTAGLTPTLAALRAAKPVALASKEVLVKAGELVMETARRHVTSILPLDSEHNAIFQCLRREESEHVRRLILTASGGPFLHTPLDELAGVGIEQALQHPNWNMGRKITIDSATMANKGLELIEARWLYDLPVDRLEAVIHPQSIVHCLVEFIDGNMASLLSPPKMTFPIQHALLYPDRGEAVHPGLDLTQALQLEFLPVDEARYPCFRLAREALRQGGLAPTIYNAANEVAVDAFLEGEIGFLDIARTIERTLEESAGGAASDLDTILQCDRDARERARKQSVTT